MLEVCKGPVDTARNFQANMLDIGFDEGVEGGGHRPIMVDVDSWEVYESTALAHCKAAVIRHEEHVYQPLFPSSDVRVLFSEISSRRVMLPCHLVEYTHMGATYRVFINGQTGDAFGLQEAIIGGVVGGGIKGTKRWLAVLAASGVLGSLSMPSAAKFVIQTVALTLRLLLMPPVAFASIAAIGGYQASLYFGSKKSQQSSFEEWEEIKRAEKVAQASMSDTWVFRTHGRTASDDAYSRQHQHADSAGRARQQRQQQRSQEREQAQQREAGAARIKARESQRQQASSQAKRQPPRVDPSDYYALLGLQSQGPAASLQDIQKAFRRELMKYHPDHNQNTGMDLAAASTRTQHILAAYKVLRSADKRAAYDRSYRRR